MLTFENVSFKYNEDENAMLDKLSFNIKKGEFVSIIGPSGCGKSTIFRLICHLLEQEEGDILVDGINIKGRSGYCGYMPQNDLLFPWRSVIENVMLPLEIKGGMSKSEMRERAEEVLEKVGLKGKGGKSPGELSGGMRQRAAFARTILTGSDLLLLDEPFSALDYLTRLSMREWLLEQWEMDKKTILFITHDVEEAVFLSERVLAVRKAPISELISIDIPLGYPRGSHSLLEEGIPQLKAELIDMLRSDENEE